MLRTLYDMYTIAEERFSDFYIDLRQNNKCVHRSCSQPLLMPVTRVTSHYVDALYSACCCPAYVCIPAGGRTGPSWRRMC